jgi:hypothetical protein
MKKDEMSGVYISHIRKGEVLFVHTEFWIKTYKRIQT